MSKTTREIISQDAVLCRLLVENIKDYAVFLLDADGIVTDWNLAAERIKGYEAAEIIGRNFSIFYIPEDRTAGRPQRELAAARKLGRLEIEGWRVRKNGSRYWVNEVLLPLKNESGKLMGFTKISRDLSERREAEDALRMMNESLERRVRERTAALEISQHELKSLALQLSRAELRERRRIAAEIHSHLAQLLALAKIRVASLSQINVSERVKPSLNELRKYLEHAIHYTRSLMTRLSPPALRKKQLMAAIRSVVTEMKAHGLQVRLKDDRKPKPVDAERLALLYQAVRELLFNVLKHARTKTAHLAVRRVGSIVEIHVQDFGVGFSHGRKLQSGFGLSQLRERLNLLGGDLEILPNGPKGTHVLMTVPLNVASARERAMTRRQKAATRAINGHIRVLIVDDNKLMREGLRKILSEQSDLKIVGEATSGQTALALSRKTRPHVVVMDVNMPGMDGIETTRRMARRSGAPRIVGFSIHDDREVESAMRKAGASAYVTKQRSPERLYAVIRESVARKRNSLLQQTK